MHNKNLLFLIIAITLLSQFVTASTRFCEDTDNGNNPESGGEVTYIYKGREKTYIDYCYNKGRKLKEYYCNNENKVKSIKYKCKDSCINGECIPETKCVDSDFGKDYLTKGVVTYIKEDSEETYTDYCYNEKKVYEYYCNSEGKLRKKKKTCKNVCIDGACMDFSYQDIISRIDVKNSTLDTETQNYNLILSSSLNEEKPIYTDEDLQQLIDNGVGEIIIPRGKYIINNPVSLKNNIVLTSHNLGDVIIYGKAEKTLVMNYGNNIKINNLIFVGNFTKFWSAIYFKNSKDIFLKDNIIYNFTNGVIFQGSGERIKIENNYFLDNGYHALALSNKRSWGIKIKNSEIKSNYFSENYQAITLLSAENVLIENNFIKDSGHIGLRIETSSFNKIKGNFIKDSLFQGMSVYMGSSNNLIEDNIIIDNNRINLDAPNDCWSIQDSLFQEYLFRNGEPYMHYSHLDTLNGYYMFQNFHCQMGCSEILLRYNCDNNVFRKNIIGKYYFDEGLNENNIKIEYYKKYYNENSNEGNLLPLSENNIFKYNYFLNFNKDSILDAGCNNLFAPNYLLYTNLKKMFFIKNEIKNHDQLLCSQPTFCNNNGVCEPEKGETPTMCPDECPCIKLGKKGSRKNFDICCEGSITEIPFPAPEGCVNDFEGDFFCTNCGDGICSEGENSCNCREDCI